MKTVALRLMAGLWVLVLSGLALAAPVRPPDLLAHATQGRAWFALVMPDPKTGEQYTTIYGREGEQGWRLVSHVPARVVGMANRGNELAVLLDNGDWMLVWGQSGATGIPLPGKGRMVALAGDEQTLWAVGRIAENAGTQPATQAERASSRLMLFALDRGKWQAKAELPGEIVAEKISLAVVGGSDPQAVVAWVKSQQTVGVARMRLPSGSWRSRSYDGIKQYKLLVDGVVPLLWRAKSDGAGVIQLVEEEESGGVGLQLPSARRAEHQRALMAGGGRLSLLFIDAGKLYEQQYKTSGSPLGEAVQVPVSNVMPEGEADNWTHMAVMLLLLLVLFNVLRRRSAIQQTLQIADTLYLASLWTRLLAGLVDIAPVLVVSAIMGMYYKPQSDPMMMLNEPVWLWSSLAANAFYILHTTAGELFFGRTIGKWIFGLRVVTLSGQRAGAGAIIVRNVLRMIDMMTVFGTLVMIPFSPLRQRIGDLAAGTLVVSDHAMPETADGAGEQRQ